VRGPGLVKLASSVDVEVDPDQQQRPKSDGQHGREEGLERADVYEVVVGGRDYHAYHQIDETPDSGSHADTVVWLWILPKCASVGLVHLLGSDAHSSRAGRPVRLAAGVEKLREVCSPEQVEWIAQEAPRAILDGAESLSPPW
jgi:hypothetical protein